MLLEVLPHSFTVCRLLTPPSCGHLTAPFTFYASTDEEYSLVCPTELLPVQQIVKREDGFRGLRLCGSLDFSLVGILARISNILAKREISIFAVSTFNTDYLFVRQERLQDAIRALEEHSYKLK